MKITQLLFYQFSYFNTISSACVYECMHGTCFRILSLNIIPCECINLNVHTGSYSLKFEFLFYFQVLLCLFYLLFLSSLLFLEIKMQTDELTASGKCYLLYTSISVILLSEMKGTYFNFFCWLNQMSIQIDIFYSSGIQIRCMISLIWSLEISNWKNF